MLQKLDRLFWQPVFAYVVGGLTLYAITSMPSCMKDSKEAKIEHERSHEDIPNDVENIENKIALLDGRLSERLEKLDTTLYEVSHSVEHLKGYVARHSILSSASDGFVPIPTFEVNSIPNWFGNQGIGITIFTDRMIDDLERLNKTLLSEATSRGGMTASRVLIDFSEIESARALEGAQMRGISPLSGDVFYGDDQAFPFTQNGFIQIRKLSRELAGEIEGLGEAEMSKYRVIGPEQLNNFASLKKSWRPVFEDAVMSGGNVWITAYQFGED